MRLALLITILLASPGAQAKVDLFLDLGEKIKGETQDSQFRDRGAIDITSWSWGLTQSGSTHLGSEVGAGKASFQDLSFTKWVDTATPALMSALASGTHTPKAVLYVRHPEKGLPRWLEITLTELIVTSVSTGAQASDTRLAESISLNFAKVKVEYFTQDATGVTKSGGDFNWDIAANTGASIIRPKLAQSGDGTDPGIVDSIARSSITYSAGDATAKLSWSSIPGRSYRVFSADSLDRPFRVWTDFRASDGDTTLIIVPAASLMQVFRVEALP